MPLLQAKCTNCGADLKVDGSKDAAICPYCGSAYIVEKTIANFYCSSVGSINASVVNIYGHEPKKLTSANTEKKTEVPEAKLMQPSQEFLQRLAVVTSFRRAVQYNLLLKSDGTLGLTQFGNFGIPTGEPWLINYRIFQWKNIKSFDVVVCTKVDIEEPYVYAQMVAGKDAGRQGEAKNSWLTGTAAWNFVAISQYILGIKADWDGLKVDPSIPSSWDGFKATRKYRGATYEIDIQNPDHVEKGVKSITVDGNAVEGTVLPTFADGTHKVVVLLG